MTKELWNRFDRIVVFDTETTGIDFDTDRIIELGAVALEKEGETGSLNCLIRLPQGHRLPPFIVDLTGITDEELAQKGVSEEEAGAAFCHLLEGAKRPLLVAYNAQFDLNFLYWFLKKSGNAQVLRLPRFLDALTVYKDRRDYPHKLCNAIEAYHLEDEAVNSHRAVDDAGQLSDFWRKWPGRKTTCTATSIFLAPIPSMGSMAGKSLPSLISLSPISGPSRCMSVKKCPTMWGTFYSFSFFASLRITS